MSSIQLFRAIGVNDLKTTHKLLEGKEGINVDAIRSFYDQTLLHKACQNLRVQIVKFLVHEKKVDVNALNKHGWTPLHLTCFYASSKGATEVTELLLKNGAHLNNKVTRNASGDIALHMACRQRNTQLIQMLLKHGAHINAVNVIGDTPLHNACRCCHIDTIKLLLANNADRHIKNMFGEGPTDLLERQSDRELFESYDKWSLAVSGVTHPTKTVQSDGYRGVMVSLNPRLGQHQHGLALKALLLVRRLPVHEVALEILGFLTPAAVERIFLPT